MFSSVQKDYSASAWSKSYSVPQYLKSVGMTWSSQPPLVVINVFCAGRLEYIYSLCVCVCVCVCASGVYVCVCVCMCVCVLVGRGHRYYDTIFLTDSIFYFIRLISLTPTVTSSPA